MINYNNLTTDNPIYSPLKLLYTAYSDQRPVVSQTIRELEEKMEDYLAPLPKEDQDALFDIFCDIYTENERLAFCAGVHIGVNLACELFQEGE